MHRARPGDEAARRLDIRMHKRPSAAHAAILAACFAGIGTAHAEEPARTRPLFAVTPFVGYAGGGGFEDPLDRSERDLDAGRNWGAFFNMAADEERQYELLFSRQFTEVEGVAPLRMSVQYLQIGGTIDYPDARRVIPYFGMTVGGTRFSPGADGVDDATKFSFTAGGGLRIPINERIGVRFDARAFVTLLNSDTSLFCATPDAGGLACRIRARSDTLIQYAATLGISVGF